MSKLAFKVLGKDMEAIKGDGMIYELNKEYSHDGEIMCGSYGFHYFESLRDCMIMYNLKESRVFECEVLGDVKDDGYIHCTNKIKLIKELSQDEIKKYIEDNLEILLNDEDLGVRREVVRQGYGLDILVHDAHWLVREEVAHQGYGLDILVHDAHWLVRLEVARHGFGLDILVHDAHWYVRLEVARHGFGLDKLLNDEDRNVRLASQKQLELQNKYK